MTPKLRKTILDLAKSHNIMSIATIRPDGYPQSTTVTYVHDGLDLYFACDRNAQKVKNLKGSNKVSLTIDRDYADWRKIRALSMGGTARLVDRPSERKRAFALLARKFPQFKKMSDEDLAATAIVKVRPRVISVIDYTKGFGHMELVRG